MNKRVVIPLYADEGRSLRERKGEEGVALKQDTPLPSGGLCTKTQSHVEKTFPSPLGEGQGAGVPQEFSHVSHGVPPHLASPLRGRGIEDTIAGCVFVQSSPGEAGGGDARDHERYR
jgi:hypothetical protein